MKTIENTSCCSAGKEGLPSKLNFGLSGRLLTFKYLFICILMLAAWWAIYLNLSPIADLSTGSLLRLFKLPAAGHLGSAIAFFIFIDELSSQYEHANYFVSPYKLLHC